MTRSDPMLNPGRDEFDAEEFVFSKHWPHMYTERRLLAALQTTRELIRWANHATLNDPAQTLPFASTLYDVVGVLGTAVNGLQQLLGQLSGQVQRESTDVSLYDDRTPRAQRSTAEGKAAAAQTALRAAMSLDQATDIVAALVGCLNDAHAELSHLGNDLPDGEWSQ